MDDVRALAMLLGEVRGQAAAGLRLRQAVVASRDFTTTPGTVGLYLGGDTSEVTGVSYLPTYCPRVGDTVFVLDNQGDLLVLGGLGSRIPHARVSLTANQSIPHNTMTALYWNANGQEDIDTDGMVTLGTSPTRITIQTPGRYLVTGMASFVPNTSGRRIASLTINGTESLRDERFPVSGGSTSLVIPSKVWSFVAGDYLELRVFQTSGGALTTQGAGGLPYYFPFLEVLWVGP